MTCFQYAVQTTTTDLYPAKNGDFAPLSLDSERTVARAACQTTIVTCLVIRIPTRSGRRILTHRW